MKVAVVCRAFSTLRLEMEWVETVDGGWNVVASTDADRIVAAVNHAWPTSAPAPVFGDGSASKTIVGLVAAACAREPKWVK